MPHSRAGVCLSVIGNTAEWNALMTGYRGEERHTLDARGKSEKFIECEIGTAVRADVSFSGLGDAPFGMRIPRCCRGPRERRHDSRLPSHHVLSQVRPRRQMFHAFHSEGLSVWQGLGMVAVCIVSRDPRNEGWQRWRWGLVWSVPAARRTHSLRTMLRSVR